MKHGSASSYKHGCRCQDCREASTIYNRELRERKSKLPEDEKPHGTWTCYTHYNCRCEDCKRAFANKMAEQRAAASKYPESQIPHGTENGYIYYGCRCDECTAVATANSVGRRTKRNMTEAS